MLIDCPLSSTHWTMGDRALCAEQLEVRTQVYKTKSKVKPPCKPRGRKPRSLSRWPPHVDEAACMATPKQAAPVNSGRHKT